MPKKSLGQNFLNEKNTLENIVKAGNLCQEDIVLEIGPGTGNLTEKILEKKPNKLIVIEKDTELSKKLNKKFDNIEVINEDILNCIEKFKFNSPIKVFGNLPYNISTKILISFIRLNDLNKIFERFIFVFQKEVADRIIAKENSKNYGRLSILTAWKMCRTKEFDINPKNFYPIPKVWSSLITFEPKKKIEKLKNTKNLEHITNIFFNQKRKMIKKPMKQLFDDYIEVSNRLDIDLKLRPQNLTVKKYIEICKYYEDLT